MSTNSDADPPSWVVSALREAGCVFAEDEARLLAAEAAGSAAALAVMVTRRAGGLPLEQVLGWAQFCGLRLEVDPGVFVPRRRSEFLAEQAAALVDQQPAGDRRHPGPVVVDLCCGAGAVGVAIATMVGGAQVHAVDVDPAAVGCARRNLAGVGGLAYEGDLYEPLPPWLRGQVELLVANAPYVPTGELALLPAEARDHEAPVALDGGADGVEVHRRIAAAALPWLTPGGHLLIETSERQAELTRAAVRRSGMASRVLCSTDGMATVVVGRR